MATYLHARALDRAASSPPRDFDRVPLARAAVERLHDRRERALAELHVQLVVLMQPALGRAPSEQAEYEPCGAGGREHMNGERKGAQCACVR